MFTKMSINVRGEEICEKMAGTLFKNDLSVVSKNVLLLLPKRHCNHSFWSLSIGYRHREVDSSLDRPACLF